MYQFCSEIGEAAIDQTVCKEFNLLMVMRLVRIFGVRFRRAFPINFILKTEGTLDAKNTPTITARILITFFIGNRTRKPMTPPVPIENKAGIEFQYSSITTSSAD